MDFLASVITRNIYAPFTELQTNETPILIVFLIALFHMFVWLFVSFEKSSIKRPKIIKELQVQVQVQVRQIR